MMGYYADIKLGFVSAELINAAQRLCRDSIRIGDFLTYDGYSSTERFIDVRKLLVSLDPLIDDCLCRSWATIMALPPGFVMDIHMDTYVLETRKTALLIPILPEADIAPTMFYADQSGDVASMRVDWQVGYPKLLNVKPHWHNVVNNGNWRCMLQISYENDYDVVLEMIKSGTLYKTIPCEIN